MLKLSDKEKRNLKTMFKSAWFKVMEKIAQDMELWVFRLFKKVDFQNTKNIAILAKNTHYLQGIEDLMHTVKTQNNCVSERKDDDEEEGEEK